MMGSDKIGLSRFSLSGAIAGAVSAFMFTVVHDLFISDIWFSLAIMLIAGALCGACVSWSYALLVNRPNLKSWLTYNLLYVTLFILLGIVSVLMFEPVTSMAALIAANGPPDQLIAQAMPMTAIFTLAAALAITFIYGFSWSHFAAALVTSVILVLLLGLNVSAIGLVMIPRGSWYLVAEMFGLILFLNGAYACLFLLLERRTLFHSSMNERQAVI